jgi:hypothetical protein
LAISQKHLAHETEGHAVRPTTCSRDAALHSLFKQPLRALPFPSV